MSRAIIYLGSEELLADVKADVRVTSVADYVRAYDRIVRCLHAGTETAITVSDGHAAAWLRHLQERYGLERFQIEELSRRRRLQEQCQIEIPDWVTEEQINRAGLLDVHISAPGRDFEDFVLEVFFSPFLARPRFPVSHLSELLRNCDPQQWDEARKRPLVGDILQRRLQKWYNEAQHAGEKQIIHWLQQSPQELTKQLATFKAIEQYPDGVGQRIMGEHFGVLRQLETLDLNRIEVNETQIGAVIDQIRVHLEQIKRNKNTPAALETVLSQASGHLEIEFDTAHDLLRTPGLGIDENIVRRVRRLFAPIQHRPYLDQALADLDLLVSKAKPSQPDPSWEDEQWLNWAVQEYLPYRFWLEETGELTGDVVDLASAYADWLYQRYPAMRLNSPHMIYRALPTHRQLMLGETPVLVLVIDNFNAKFYADFQRYMQGVGFFSEGTQYYVAMLPSCTEVSKKCLFTGQPEPFNGTAYEKPVQEAWSKALNGRRVTYLPHVGALRAIKQRKHDVYFLNYLPLDIALHQDAEQIGISHAQAVRSHLRAVAKDVQAFSQRIGAEHNLNVIVTSDHGSTRIPGDAPNLIDPAFFARRVQDKHHRYVTVRDDELIQLPANVQYQCYTFERERFGLGSNYLAAKVYYRFRPTTESIYVHGGLTPEETLVPVAVFKPMRVMPKSLATRLLQNEFRYNSKSEIRLELVNTNAYDCQSLHIEILNTTVEATDVRLEKLGAMNQEVVNFSAYFRRGEAADKALRIRISYEFLGQPYQQETEVIVKMKSMMEQAFDLDELL
jgi:hypothetical protein